VRVLRSRYREQLRWGGVDVFDKEKEWRCAADGRRGSILGPESAAAACTLCDTEIAALVVKREDARRSKVRLRLKSQALSGDLHSRWRELRSIQAEGSHTCV